MTSYTKVSSTISIPVKTLETLIDPKIGPVDSDGQTDPRNKSATAEFAQALKEQNSDKASKGLGLILDHAIKIGSSCIIQPTKPSGSGSTRHHPWDHSEYHCSSRPTQDSRQQSGIQSRGVRRYRCVTSAKSGDGGCWYGTDHQAKVTFPPDLGAADAWGRHPSCSTFQICEVPYEPTTMFSGEAVAESSVGFYINSTQIREELGEEVQDLRVRPIKPLGEGNAEIEVSCFVLKDETFAAGGTMVSRPQTT